MSLAFQDKFAIKTAAVRVHFGAGARARVGEMVAGTGARRALVLCTPQQESLGQEIASVLGDACAGIFAGAQMHTPVEVTEDAMGSLGDNKADCLVAAGGGSTVGLGKALALRSGLPQVVLPTTYAGSEATPILGQTEGGVKSTLVDESVQPGVVVYDPELLCGLPVDVTVASALNAIAHAAEALYARDRNPLSTSLAIEGIKCFARGLPEVVAAPRDVHWRGLTLYGAWLCGSVLGQVGMSLHHKLCHALGGLLDLPHAQTHAIILPHAIGYNAEAVPELLEPLAGIFGGGSPGGALHGFALRLGAPSRLRDLGMEEADIARVAKQAVAKPYWNPRPVTEDALHALLRAAWEGASPAA